MTTVGINYTFTKNEMLVRCLIMAITAPNDEKSQMASDLAERIAQGLTKKQVNQCKKKALEFLENE